MDSIVPRHIVSTLFRLSDQSSRLVIQSEAKNPYNHNLLLGVGILRFALNDKSTH